MTLQFQNYRSLKKQKLQWKGRMLSVVDVNNWGQGHVSLLWEYFHGDQKYRKQIS